MILNLPAQGIWTNLYLNQLAADAIGRIAIDVNCIWAREYLPTTAGSSVLTLPSYVRTLRRVTWLGRTLDAMNWEEMQMLTPATVFISPNNPANVESSQGKPLYYSMHPTNPYDVRLFPTPNQTFTVASFPPDPYSPQFNEQACSIEYYREPDTSNANPNISIPPYILRRTQKAYVLWRAYSSEGKGQDLRAASHYQQRYTYLIANFIAINEGCFVGKKYAVDDGMLEIDNFRYPRPTLPSRGFMNLQFERVIF